MRAFTAAAIQIAPVPGPLTAESVAANLAKCVAFTRDCVAATGAELVVLPESATTGFTPGIPTEQLWELMTTLPATGSADGTVIEPVAAVTRELGVHVCVGTYERGPSPAVVHNSSVLIGPDGSILGVYRKTHPFCSEIVTGGGWVTPGDTVTVCDTELGRIGMIICFDGDYPELSRIQAVQGAEVICRPSALLRSADIWELTSRARAYDNHVYVIGANAVGVDPAGVLYFGNSHIVTPIAHIAAKAATHECWVSARLDPDEAMASLTPGSSVGQAFDHLRDRNLDLIRNHRDELERPAATSFPHKHHAFAEAPVEE
jgi:predicted amidohydrolase